jgi:ankyrin repeat protein
MSTTLFPNLQEQTKDYVFTYFLSSCIQGKLEHIKHIMSFNNGQYQDIVQAEHSFGFRSAAEKGHLEIVKFLLSSPELTIHAKINDFDDAAIIGACANNQLDIVQFLLTSNEIATHANIQAQNNASLRSACLYGHIDVLKYLLTSTELKNHTNQTSLNDSIFILTRSKEIQQYLIFECNIELTENLKKITIDNEILQMFSLRDLNKKLHNETNLNNRSSIGKKL